jgi:hypothetical protein
MPMLSCLLRPASQAQLEKAMNDALARLRSELEAAAAKDKADALSAQESKLKVRARRHGCAAAQLPRPLAVLTAPLCSTGCLPVREGCAGG